MATIGNVTITNGIGFGSPGRGVTMNPTSVYGLVFGAGTATSDNVTATPFGLVPPTLTYAWTRVSGSTFTINSPATATTSFSASLTAGQILTGVYRCTITDLPGNSAFGDVTVTLESLV